MKRIDPVQSVTQKSTALMFTANIASDRQNKDVKLTQVLDRIERLKERTSIDVSGQDLRAESLPLIVEKINSLPHVKELLVRDHVRNLGATQLAKLKFVERLDVSSADMDYVGLLTLIRANQFTYINFDKNTLSQLTVNGSEIKELLDAIKASPKFIGLNVVRTCVIPEIKEHIVRALEYNKGLVKVVPLEETAERTSKDYPVEDSVEESSDCCVCLIC